MCGAAPPLPQRVFVARWLVKQDICLHGVVLVYMALVYGLDDLGFDFRRGLGIFLLTIESRQDLGPTQPPIQWVPWVLSLRVKRPGCEADHSSPASAEVNNTWSYTVTPPIRLHVLVLS